MFVPHSLHIPRQLCLVSLLAMSAPLVLLAESQVISRTEISVTVSEELLRYLDALRSSQSEPVAAASSPDAERTSDGLETPASPEAIVPVEPVWTAAAEIVAEAPETVNEPVKFIVTPPESITD